MGDNQEYQLTRKGQTMAVRFNSYNVRPRYTPGSPAVVDEATAQRVAREERDAYEHALTGAWGEAERQRAELLGVSSIVYSLHEDGSGRRFRWVQADLITDTITRRLDSEALHRSGYMSFAELPTWARERVPQTNRAYDMERRYWRLAADVEEYQPELVR